MAATNQTTTIPETSYAKEHACVKFVLANSESGNPKSVIAAFDKFAYEQHWIMAVGDTKGKHVEDVVIREQPRIMVELGLYLGYSAVRFASLLADDTSSHYYSFDIDQEHAKLAQQVLAHAGLDKKVTIIPAAFSERYGDLRSKYGVDKVDLFFIDHEKSVYLPDMKIIEGSGLLRNGSCIVADNIIFPGAPDYLEYMQANSNFQSQLIDTELEYSRGEKKDAILVSKYLGN